MKKVTIFFIVFVFDFFIYVEIDARDNTRYKTFNNFKKIEGLSEGKGVNFYPLTNGDYWEFIESDTATIVNQFYEEINFSVTKEILYDTLMSNGITYKKIKWNNEANSVNYPPTFEFHRKDSSGNVYLYYQDYDYLLFDVTADTGYTYPSHLPDYIWKVADRYNVVGFGDTLSAIDFNLLENGITLKEIYTLVENFGLIYFGKNININQLPEGNLWGAVINGTEFGTLIVNKQTVDWKEFYPLHIGDYWVYEGMSGNIPFIETHRITGDTLMPDANIYFIKDNAGFERLDCTGRLYTWSNDLQAGTLIYRFTDVVGDTNLAYNLSYSMWRLDNKLFWDGRFEIYRFLYPDLIYYGEYYDQRLGLYEWHIEGGYGILKGAYINGRLFGDTTITKIEENKNARSDNFKLYQNYPNPFNPVTTIKYTIPNVGTSFMKFIQLKVYNALGEEVATLVNEEKPAGSYAVKFDGSNLPSGVYIYRLTAGNYSAVKKLVLLK